VPQADTQQFGSIEYVVDDVIEFPLGLPAFEQETSFLLITPSKTKPLVFLQSLGRSELCFVTLPLEVVDPNYQLSVSIEDWKILSPTGQILMAVGQADSAQVQCLAIISLTDSRPTANLLAPLVINRVSKRAVQAIRLDSVYSHQHPVEALICS
jgi:flagellar assembly factor FliW